MSDQYTYVTWAEVTSRNSTVLKDKIEEAVIGIAGCGGLGSNAAIALARTGIKKLIIADFDKVEPSNLNRQQFTIADIGTYKTDALERVIRQFNPWIEIEKHTVKLTPENLYGIYSEPKIIIEAFDRVSEKHMIMTTFGRPEFAEKILICASGLAGYGSSNLITTEKLSENIYVCGDNQTDNTEENGLMLPRVMIAAGHQANLALQLL